MRFRTFGSETQAGAIALPGIRGTPESKQYIPQVVVNPGEVWFEAQRRAHTCGGLFMAPESDENPPEVAVRVPEVGLQSQCLSQACLGLVEAPRLRSALPRLAHVWAMSPPIESARS